MTGFREAAFFYIGDVFAEHGDPLTHLLNVPEPEADTGLDGAFTFSRLPVGGSRKGIVLEDYLHAQFDSAEANPGDDLFSALVKAAYRGSRPRPTSVAQYHP